MNSGTEQASDPRPAPAAVWAALENVHDAHIPVSLRRMGMVRSVEVEEGGVVKVELCIPCMGCPGVGLMKDQVRDQILAIEGVTAVEIEEGMHLPWSRDLVDEDVKHLMRNNGLQI